MTLAPSFGQALPTLETVPTEYNHEVNAELLYDLGAALVKAGLGSPEAWQQCGGNAVVFAQRSIMDAIGAERSKLLQRNVEFHLQVSDVLERDGYPDTRRRRHFQVSPLLPQLFRQGGQAVRVPHWQRGSSHKVFRV
jgi:hypothetical protein